MCKRKETEQLKTKITESAQLLESLSFDDIEKINKNKKPNKGYGPNSPDEQPVAEEIHVEIDEKELKVGDKCPECGNKNIVKSVETSFLCFLGRLPLLLKKYVFHNLRCSLCGKVFRPQAPEDMGDEKVRSLKSTIIIGEKFFPDKKIAIGIFSTNDKTSGREVEEILSLRREDLPPPFFMADGLGANNLKDINITYHFGACMAHARRKFWAIQDFFPDLCKLVLKSFTKIYSFEKHATEKGLSIEQRHKLRHIHSRSVLRALKKWFESAEKNETASEDSLFYVRNFP
jgi:rubredoxin